MPVVEVNRAASVANDLAVKDCGSPMSSKELERYLSTMPRCVVENISKRAGTANVFGRRRLGKCAMMIIDISGFTKLTEKYVHNKDKIQQILNAVMVPLIDLIKQSSFELIDIAGDALLFFRPMKATETSGENVDARCIMSFATRTHAFVANSPTFRKEALDMKYAAVVGDLHVDLYKGVRNGWIVDGPACRKLARALKLAERGDFIVDDETKKLIGKVGVKVTERNAHFCVPLATTTVSFANVNDLNKEIRSKDRNSAFEIMNLFIPDLVLACKEDLPTINDAIIGPAVICFVRIRSLDNSPVSFDDMQKFFAQATESLEEREGCMRQFLRDDKGTVFIGTFGAGKHVEKPAHHALMWARDIEQIGVSCSLRLSTGITMGTVYQGPLGSAGSRIDYTLMGFEVNLSARYMSWAVNAQRSPPAALEGKDVTQLTLMTNDIAVGASMLGITVTSIGENAIKGSAERFEAYAITCHTGETSDGVQESLAPELDSLASIYGRDDVLHELCNRMKNDGVCCIEGASGMGKTLTSLHATRRFLKANVNESDPLVLCVSANEARKSEVFLPIKMILRSIHSTTKLLNNESGDNFNSRLAEMIDLPEYNDHCSLLRPLIPGGEQDKSKADNADLGLLAPEEEKLIMVRMLAHLLHHLGSQQGTVIVFENFQWFDADSIKVVEKLVSLQRSNLVSNCSFLITCRSGLAPITYEKIIEQGTYNCVLEPLSMIEDTFMVVMDTLKVSMDVFDSVYSKNEEFAELVHQSTMAVPKAIIVCCENLVKDDAVKATRTTLRLARQAKDLPIFEALYERIVSKFLAMEKDEQIVIRTAACIGRHFDNDFLRMAVTPITSERLHAICMKLVENDLFRYRTEGDTSTFDLQSEGIVQSIKSTMLEEQRVKLYTKLSNQHNTLSGDDATYHEMALNFAEGMGAHGKIRLGRILHSYGYWALNNTKADIVMETFCKLVSNIKELAEVVSGEPRNNGAIVHPAAGVDGKAPSDLDQQLKLTKADVHEICCILVCTSTSLDVKKSLDYTRMACETIGFPYVGAFCSSTEAAASEARLKFGPLNWFRYPMSNIPSADYLRVVPNHVALCNAVAYIHGMHFGNTHAYQWWMNEGRNIQRVCKDAMVITASLGSYAVATASYSNAEEVPFQAFASFQSTFTKMKDDPATNVKNVPNKTGSPTLQANRLTDNTFNSILVQMLIPQKFNFDNKGDHYEAWMERDQTERIRSNDFFKFIGPMMVSCAHGMFHAPCNFKNDCEAAIQEVRLSYRREKNGIERSCISYVLWFCGHMLDSGTDISTTAYETSCQDQYKKYVAFAMGSPWSTCVLPGTKLATLLIHHLSICTLGTKIDDLEATTNLLINHWTQIEQYTGALKQVPVAIFMAFETTNFLLMILEPSVKKFFNTKLVRILDWAQKTLQEIKVFPAFTEIALEYFKACRLFTNSQKAIAGLRRVAGKAQGANMLLIYANAMANIAMLSSSPEGSTDMDAAVINAAVGKAGIATYARARYATGQHINKRLRRGRKMKQLKESGDRASIPTGSMSQPPKAVAAAG